MCGPPVGERARFQNSTLRAQLRVAPSSRVSAFQARLPAYDGDHWPPEHSVNQMPLSGAASCTAVWALGLPGVAVEGGAGHAPTMALAPATRPVGKVVSSQLWS